MLCLQGYILILLGSLVVKMNASRIQNEEKRSDHRCRDKREATNQ